MTQPTVSLHIRALEEFFCARLFERGGRSQVRLTREGRVLLEYAKAILSLVERAQESLSKCGGQQLSVVRIAVGNSLGAHVIPYLIAQFNRIHPHVEVQIKLDPTPQVYQHLLNHAIDIGIMNDIPREDPPTYYPFLEAPLWCVAPYWVDLPTDRPVNLASLTCFPLVTRRKGQADRTVLEAFLDRQGVPIWRWKRLVEVESSELQRAAVEAGLGIAFVCKYVVERSCSLRLIKRILVAEGEPRKTYYVCVNPRRPLSHAAKCLLDFLCDPNVLKQVGDPVLPTKPVCEPGAATALAVAGSTPLGPDTCP